MALPVNEVGVMELDLRNFQRSDDKIPSVKVFETPEAEDYLHFLVIRVRETQKIVNFPVLLSYMNVFNLTL